MQNNAADPHADRVLINTAEVRRRMGGISEVTLWRMLNSPEYESLGFPKPIKRARLNYWFSNDIRAVQDRLASPEYQAKEKSASPPRPAAKSAQAASS